MTPIEQQTYQDGFRILLLHVAFEQRSDRLAFEAVLFAGGVEQKRVRQEPVPARDAPSRRQIRSLLPDVIQPPHVVCLVGRGARSILEESVPDYVPLLRILPLYPVAALLASEKPTQPPDWLARVYGLPFVEGTAIAATENDEHLLWAVLARAGAKNLTWPQLLDLQAERTSRPDFVCTEFSEADIRCMTEEPGVYVMRDRQGAVLYVGKAANLARRLADYFRATSDLSTKLEAIRARIHSLDLRVVGTELEALLLEQSLITDLHPTLNRQRVVVEESGRYGAPLTPRAVFSAVTKRNRVDIFFLLPDQDLVQLTLSLAKPARRRLRALIEYTRGDRPQPIRGTGIRVWGAVGCALAQRHLAAKPGQYHWLDLSRDLSSDELVQQVIQSLGALRADPENPGEIRPIAR